MQQLDALAREAVALAQGASLDANEAEVARQMQICNACRYCEGFCAVFPAMTRRLDFVKADVHYLANLCHNCGACLHACQYAPPHEFAVNVPKAMAQVRVQTYADFAWPPALGALYRRNGLVLALATAIGLALFMVLLLRVNGSIAGQALAANFYAVFPHNTLVLMFGVVFAFAVLALAMGARAFWGATRQVPKRAVSSSAKTGQAAAQAAHDALTLKYLDGGHGDGCNESSDAFTLARRRFHHATFYGFMLCFAATCVATLYHYAFGRHAPYPIRSLPVLLGTLGGIGLLVGPAGLLWLNLRRDPAHGDPQQKPM
ncbi:MAG: Citrate utilization protein, partial [Ramlibacter sp.]|nr:Citrate utilization protein [Ramlibacter sp.]